MKTELKLQNEIKRLKQIAKNWRDSRSTISNIKYPPLEHPYWFETQYPHVAKPLWKKILKNKYDEYKVFNQHNSKKLETLVKNFFSRKRHRRLEQGVVSHNPLFDDALGSITFDGVLNSDQSSIDYSIFSDDSVHSAVDLSSLTATKTAATSIPKLPPPPTAPKARHLAKVSHGEIARTAAAAAKKRKVVRFADDRGTFSDAPSQGSGANNVTRSDISTLGNRNVTHASAIRQQKAAARSLGNDVAAAAQAMQQRRDASSVDDSAHISVRFASSRDVTTGSDAVIEAAHKQCQNLHLNAIPVPTVLYADYTPKTANARVVHLATKHRVEGARAKDGVASDDATQELADIDHHHEQPSLFDDIDFIIDSTNPDSFAPAETDRSKFDKANFNTAELGNIDAELAAEIDSIEIDFGAVEATELGDGSDHTVYQRDSDIVYADVIDSIADGSDSIDVRSSAGSYGFEKRGYINQYLKYRYGLGFTVGKNFNDCQYHYIGDDEHQRVKAEYDRVGDSVDSHDRSNDEYPFIVVRELAKSENGVADNQAIPELLSGIREERKALLESAILELIKVEIIINDLPLSFSDYHLMCENGEYSMKQNPISSADMLNDLWNALENEGIKSDGTENNVVAAPQPAATSTTTRHTSSTVNEKDDGLAQKSPTTPLLGS